MKPKTILWSKSGFVVRNKAFAVYNKVEMYI